jgi:hypothetical protein
MYGHLAKATYKKLPKLEMPLLLFSTIFVKDSSKGRLADSRTTLKHRNLLSCCKSTPAMKTTLLLSLAALLFVGTVLAQVPNHTETDCNGNARSLYAAGDAGRPVIIASKGFDCSICMGQAPSIGVFAASYAGQIDVWGAMIMAYSSSSPNCNQAANWVANYNWGSVFTFPDVQNHWVGTGVPRYIVVHPQTKEAVYTGSSFTAAANAATALLPLSSPAQAPKNPEIKAFADQQQLQIRLSHFPSGLIHASVVNLVGNEVARFRIDHDGSDAPRNFPFAERPGVYILRVEQGGTTQALRFVVR